jgi:RNA polymerase sigma-32 factor
MANAYDKETTRYIASILAIPALQREEELELCRAYRERDDRTAGERVIASNLRHVLPLALRYRNLGVPLNELIAQGTLGMLEALRRFEPSRELRFATYANHWIRAEILSFALRCRSMVGGGRGPLRAKYAVQMRRERACLQGQLGDDAEVVRILSERFGKAEDQIASILYRLDHGDASLDATDADTESKAFVDYLVAADSGDEDRLELEETQTALARTIAEVKAGLNERERFMLDRRLMADQEAQLSLHAIGLHFGVSRERARQIESQVKAKLRVQLSTLASDLALLPERSACDRSGYAMQSAS